MRETPTGRRVGALLTALSLAAVLAACGQQGAAPAGSSGAGTSTKKDAQDTQDADSHEMTDGSSMSDAEMAQMGSDQGDEVAPAPGSVTHRTGANAPSAAAGMICSREVADSVRATFELRTVPTAIDGWADRTYTCTYRLPGGKLRLAVKDLDEAVPGKAWFTGLSGRLGARPIRGVQSLGLPSAETPVSGEVLFLKDDKTLLVDASGIGRSTLPKGLSRSEAAYGVAASVVACWSE